MERGSRRLIKNIAISGDVGTGTTTLSKTMASVLVLEHRNAGDYFRRWHVENNVRVDDTLLIPEDLDRQIDEQFSNDMKICSKVVFESHLAGWQSRDYGETYKILCIAAEPVMLARINARENDLSEQAGLRSMKRTRDLTTKFQRLYGVENPYDPSFFDLVIDTTDMSAGEVLDMAMKNYLKMVPGGDELAKILDLE